MPSTPTRRSPGRWRRGFAAAAAVTLPFGVAACAEDEPDEPDIIEEEVDPDVENEDEGGTGGETGGETESPTDDAESPTDGETEESQ